jgi:hypothetical protein
MPNTDPATQLVKLLDSSTWLLNDCRTLLWARFHPDRPLDNASLGGGNYLITMGCFSVLSLSCKVLWVLQGKDVWTEEGVEAVRERLKELRKTYRGLKDARAPRPGEINEQAAFANFVSHVPVDLGLVPSDKQAAELAWKELRNTLSHMAGLPFGAGAAVFLPTDGGTFDEAFAELDSRPEKAITRGKRGVTCNADVLVRDLETAVSWLCGEITTGKFPQERVEAALAWARKHYGA